MGPVAPPHYEPGSYRDRHGRVFYGAGSVYRALSASALQDWEALRATALFRRATAEGKLVRTEQVDSSDLPDPCVFDHWAGVLKHEPIPFVSYPYEWSFGMLQDAALLVLDLLGRALPEDLILKDASAFNVQWIGARPVYIDIPSFQKLMQGRAWAGYRQFCQLFLYPLLLQAYKDVAFQPWLRGSLDGIEPEQCKNLMSARDLLRAGVFTHVYLHAKFESGYSETRTDVQTNLSEAGFQKGMIASNVRRLAKIVRGLTWKRARSTWSEYARTNTYSDADRAKKEQFVREAVRSRRRDLVWDLGTNTGAYARIAAEHAAYVVAMDKDHLTIDQLYQTLKAEECHSVLPLVSNLVDASPNMGWRGTERKALLDRGRPDLTLCLALVHHLVIGANIPLAELIDWLAGLQGDLVIEFVTKADPMVKVLLRNKQDNYADYELGNFERVLGERFQIVRREPLASATRVLYYAAAKR